MTRIPSKNHSPPPIPAELFQLLADVPHECLLGLPEYARLVRQALERQGLPGPGSSNRDPLQLAPPSFQTPRVSAGELERVRAHNEQPHDPMAIRGGSLTQQTQSALLNERRRVEKEK